MRKILQLPLLILITIALMTVGAFQVFALQTCVVEQQSTEQMIPGVRLTWDSAFLCGDAPETDDFTFTVNVQNDSTSLEAVTLEALDLHQVTPRPLGQTPPASGGTADLPLTLAPGDSVSFTISGSYMLVETDEGFKVNLHFLAAGQGADSSEPFHLGINAIIRGEDAVDNGDDDDDDDGNGEPGGPPAWVPGPPPWAGDDDENNDDEDNDDGGEANGPPPWAPGPPPWAGGDDDDEDEGAGGPPPWAGNGDDNDGDSDGAGGPPPWAGHGEEDENEHGTRNGPPSWVPGPPPFADPGGG